MQIDPKVLRKKSAVATQIVKEVSEVVARKPHPDEFFRVHPDPEFQLDWWFYKAKSERDRIYLVSDLVDVQLLPGAYLGRLFTVINRSGDVFLWPQRLPEGDGGRGSQGYRSALAIADIAIAHWVRMAWQFGSNLYESSRAESDLGAPNFPDDLDFTDLLNKAYRDTYIDSEEHQVFRQLRGVV